MPFVYYGGKKGRAQRYPPPGFRTIIEPFAGSAGYALAWAKPTDRVILIEKDPLIVNVWRDLQADDAADELRAIPLPVKGEPVPAIVALSTGNAQRNVATDRMIRDWEAMRDRLIAAIPRVRDWTVIEGDYTDAPNVRATWFIDPPYAPRADGRDPGGSYVEGSEGIDYTALADWCRARQGQVIVCEQEGADWLPFRPLYLHHSQSGTGEHPPHVEVVWTRTPGNVLATPKAKRLDEQRKTRRRSRR